jgi:hypothetical protein
MQSLTVITQIVNLLSPLLAFLSSYIVYYVHNTWEFAGMRNITHLDNVHQSDYSILHVHLFLTFIWIIFSNYSLYSQGRGLHAVLSRISLLAGLTMWMFVPRSEQMSSCWPIVYFGTRVSRDVTGVSGIIGLMVFHLLVGWWSIFREKNLQDHRLYVCQAILASNSPALMRIILVPGVLFFYFTRTPHPSIVGKYMLEVGEWLYVKELTYSCLSFLAIAPLFYPPWSPYARKALELVMGQTGEKTRFLDARMCCLFLVFCGYQLLTSWVRFWNYSREIGLKGGEICEVI